MLVFDFIDIQKFFPQVLDFPSDKTRTKIGGKVVQHFNLNNGSVFVLADAAGGVYSGDQIKAICEVADSESAFLKVTEDQRIGFMVAPDRLPDVQKRLAKVGVLLRAYRNVGVASPKACLGDLCPHKEQDALGDAIEVGRYLNKTFGSDRPFVSIGLNGCSSACTQSAVDDIHIVGESSGYKISIGGKHSEMPQLGQFLAENIEKEKLPDAIAKILNVYFENRQEDERIFDVLERTGISAFMEALSPSDGLDEVSFDEPSDAPASSEEVAVAGDELSLESASETSFETEATDFQAEEELSLDSELSLEPDLASSTEAEPAEEAIVGASDDILGSTEKPLAGADASALEEDFSLSDDILGSNEPALANSSFDESNFSEEPLIADEQLLDESLSLPEDIVMDDSPATDSEDSIAVVSQDEDLFSSEDAPLTGTTDVAEEESLIAADDSQSELVSPDDTEESLSDQFSLSDSAPAALDETFATIEDEAEVGDSVTPLETEGLSALGEEEGIEVEEATAEDVDTMTRTIRSEVELEEQFANKALDLPIPQSSQSGTSAPSEARHQQPSRTPAQHGSRSSGRFKVHLDGGIVHLTLPSGAEFKVNIAELSDDDCEIEFQGSLLRISRTSDNAWEVTHSGITMVVHLSGEGSLEAA